MKTIMSELIIKLYKIKNSSKEDSENNDDNKYDEEQIIVLDIMKMLINEKIY